MGNLQSLEGQNGSRPVLSKTELERLERRLRRMGRGEMEMALSDLQLIPEAMGNPYIGGIFQSADRNRDGYLDQQDVRGLMERLIQLRDPEAKHQLVFSMYDSDGDGLVTREDLVDRLLTTNRRGLSEERIDQIARVTLEAFDHDGDGALCYDEFVQLITTKPGGFV